MNLTELKLKAVPELVEIAESMKLDNVARAKKQDIIFAILKAHAKSGEDIFGDGVLEILQDGFGFLRAAAVGSRPEPDHQTPAGTHQPWPSREFSSSGRTAGDVEDLARFKPRIDRSRIRKGRRNASAD